VPAPVSASRDGTQPQLALLYDSGAGNGPFGLGWALSAGAITRKTDKGLPRYIESGPDADTFLFSGAEDLVPVLDAATGWTHATPTRTLGDGSSWVIERYRPRVERMFARIERWTPAAGVRVSKPRFHLLSSPLAGSGSIGGCFCHSCMSRFQRYCGCSWHAGAASSPRMSNCSFCAISCWCFVGSSRGLRFGQPIALSSRRSAGCFRLQVGTG
jgi:hypothetical protein